MARSKDIRKTTKFYTDILIRNYEDTDPDRKNRSPINKTEVAIHTIEVWWQLFGRLIGWAQAHLTGRAIIADSNEVVSWIKTNFDTEFHEDSDFVEYLGWQYIANRYFEESETLQNFDDLFEVEFVDKGREILSTRALRSLICNLLLSRSADSSFWRFELQESLRALNFGQLDPLSTPENGKRKGKPYSLLLWKHKALLQVYFLTGKGFKKYAALDQVSKGIGQSPETLRTWEKILLEDEYFKFELWSAEVAGMFETELKNMRWNELPGWEEMGMFHGTFMAEMAAYLLPQIEQTDFEKIMKMIQYYRARENGA